MPIVGEVDVQVCESCGAVYYEGPSLLQFSREAALALIKEDIATGQSLRFIRKVLGLSGKALAGLLRLAPEHVSRMENGRAPVEPWVFAIVGALMRDAAAGRDDTAQMLHSLVRASRMRDNRIAQYRSEIGRMPPGPAREVVEAKLRDWLANGTARMRSLAIVDRAARRVPARRASGFRRANG
ncbi:MAG: hypothetical protein JST92_18220 [Deltaproteobacteria bacterium]|nr:hypothetical protein [Deltaproteobacteria bacterium]